MPKTVTFQRVNDNIPSDPKKAMVVYGQPPSERIVSDDHGINFFGLPQRVRDCIYRHIFVEPTRIGADSRFTKPFWRDAIGWRNHSFSGTCRRVWNESLRVYLKENGFEFFYIRPFLEFLEKIGIRGRQLLTDVRWHHHRRSTPFIVIRLLRSCSKLQKLEVFARVTVKGRQKFWYGVPFLHPLQFFLNDRYQTIAFGETEAFGSGAMDDEELPDLRSRPDRRYENASLRTLDESLKKVKWEIDGSYKRHDLPEIWVNGMCHWKYVMMAEKKRKQKDELAIIEANRRRKLGHTHAEESSHPLSMVVQEYISTGVSRTPSVPPQEPTPPHGEAKDEDIDKDDGYVVEKGDLMKDGILVAKGDIFEPGHLLDSS